MDSQRRGAWHSLEVEAWPHPPPDPLPGERGMGNGSRLCGGPRFPPPVAGGVGAAEAVRSRTWQRVSLPV